MACVLQLTLNVYIVKSSYSRKYAETTTILWYRLCGAFWSRKSRFSEFSRPSLFPHPKTASPALPLPTDLWWLLNWSPPILFLIFRRFKKCQSCRARQQRPSFVEAGHINRYRAPYAWIHYINSDAILERKCVFRKNRVLSVHKQRNQCSWISFPVVDL